MAYRWTRSLTSQLFPDRRPLPRPHPKPPDLNRHRHNVHTVLFLHSFLRSPLFKEASPPTKKTKPPASTVFFQPTKRTESKAPALTDHLCPFFTHLCRSPLITIKPINDFFQNNLEIITNEPPFFITGQEDNVTTTFTVFYILQLESNSKPLTLISFRSSFRRLLTASTFFGSNPFQETYPTD